MQIMNFNRPFVLFSYTASHGLLLLRSGKSSMHSTRIDVLFQDVVAMECRSSLNSLIVEEMGPEFLKDVRSRAADVMEPGHKVYSLSSGNWVGFIVGGIVSQHEDQREFFEASSLT